MPVIKTWNSKLWIKEARKEFGKYKESNDATCLAQAGEKLYNALTLHLDEKTKKRLIKYSDIKKEAMKDKETKKIFEDAYWLHVFFYRGFTEDIKNEESKYKRVYKYLKEVI